MAATRARRAQPDTDYTADAVAAWQRILGGDVDVPALEATMRLRRACILLDEHLRAALRPLRHIDNVGDYEVLSALRRHDHSMSPGGLAKRLHVTKAGITGRLDRLEAHGFLKRYDDETDRRKWQVRLTTDGRKAVDRAFRALQQAQREFFGDLDPDDRAGLSRGLRRLLIEHDDRPQPD